MRRMVIAVLVLAGCRFDLPGAQPQCTESQGACVCLEPPGVCVECTAEDERNCGGTRPQCGSDHRCRACFVNDDCGSGACLEDGSCADASRVIYTAPGGGNAAGCGRAPGQDDCSLAQALLEIGPPRDIIRLAPGSYVVPNTIDGLDFGARSATVIARGALITRTGTGAMMSARNGQTLKLVGGELQGPNGDDGLKCSTSGRLLVHEAAIVGMSGSGIETDGCELTVSRATIRNNLQGGIHMVNTPRVATITNNFVHSNGSVSPIGGMVLRLVHPGSRVEFNTVVDNNSLDNTGQAGGIVCEGQGYDAPFNLVYRNEGGAGGQVQVLGTCTFAGSYVRAAAFPTENVVGFERPNDGVNPSFRLTEASPPGIIRDVFDCTGTDFEHHPRPEPPGGKCDFGADEYRAGR